MSEIENALAVVIVFNFGRKYGIARPRITNKQKFLNKTDTTAYTRRPASADRTARRHFQAVFPIIIGSFPTNVFTRFEYGSGRWTNSLSNC